MLGWALLVNAFRAVKDSVLRGRSLHLAEFLLTKLILSYDGKESNGI